MSSIIVPYFSSHVGDTAWLEWESWMEIFDSVPSEECEKEKQLFYRKVAKVRMAKKDAFYHWLTSIRGLHYSADSVAAFRQVYGELLFHIQDFSCATIPYRCQMQSMVSCSSRMYSGKVASVTAYITKNTRFSELLYKRVASNKIKFEPCGSQVINNEDYDYGILKTNRMLWECNYSSPPLRGK